MTNHYDEMSVSPDPVQAEELRQRLHARMASVSRDDHHGRSDLHLESDRLEPDKGRRPNERALRIRHVNPQQPHSRSARAGGRRGDRCRHRSRRHRHQDRGSIARRHHCTDTDDKSSEYHD